MSIITAISLWTIACTVVLPLCVLAAHTLIARMGNITQRVDLTAVHTAERIYTDTMAAIDAAEACCFLAGLSIWGASEAIKAHHTSLRAAVKRPVVASTSEAECTFFGPMLRNHGRFVSRLMSDYQADAMDRLAATTDPSVHVDCRDGVYLKALSALPAHGLASADLWLVEGAPLALGDVLARLGEHEAATHDASVKVDVSPSLYRALLGQWGLYQWSAGNYRQHQDFLGACVASAEEGKGRIVAVS
jgi:hypothetical protein